MAQENNGEDNLVERLKHGDEPAFNVLFARYRGVVYSLCYRFTRNSADAQDLVQEVFVKIYQKIRTYDTRAKFSTWLYRVTVNHCLSFKRKTRPLPYSDLVRSSLDFTKRVELRKSIDEAIVQLPKRQRMVFVLRHNQELSFDEIAGLLQITSGAAKAHHHFAVSRMKELLSQMGY